MSPIERERYTGDQPALPTESELIDRFWGRVCVLAARRLRDASEAQDVAQETIRRVIAAMREGRVQHADALPAFVFQTARHICMHSHRHAEREERALARFSAGEDAFDKAPDALVELISAEDQHAVRAALERLPDGERTLLTMVYFDERESASVAAALRITAGALRVRKHRALARLAELLGRSVQVKRSPFIGNT